MSGKFISFIVAASVAVTGMTAAPAQASERDLARALAAIAGVAIVGAAIHDSRKDQRYATPSKHRSKKSFRAAPRRAYQQPYAYQPRRAVRERRVERRHGYGHQRGYSARPYRYGH